MQDDLLLLVCSTAIPQLQDLALGYGSKNRVMQRTL